MPKNKSSPGGLCYRCEHRATYHEKGRRPRMECGDSGSVVSCYMFSPVKPIKLKKAHPDDERPTFSAPLLSCRLKRENIAKCITMLTEDSVLYQIPENSVAYSLANIIISNGTAYTDLDIPISAYNAIGTILKDEKRREILIGTIKDLYQKVTVK